MMKRTLNRYCIVLTNLHCSCILLIVSICCFIVVILYSFKVTELTERPPSYSSTRWSAIDHNAHHTDVSDWGFPISKNDTSIVVSSNDSCRSNNGSLHPLERATRSTAAAAAALLIRSTTAPPALVTVTHVSSDALSDAAGAPTVTEVPTVSAATTESVILTATFAAKSFGLSAPTTMELLELFARITEKSASVKPSKSLVIESVFAESLLKTINSLDGIVKFVTESTKPAAAATEFPKSPAAATCTVESSVSTESSWSSMLASESVEPLSTAIVSFSSVAANDSVAVYLESSHKNFVQYLAWLTFNSSLYSRSQISTMTEKVLTESLDTGIGQLVRVCMVWVNCGRKRVRERENERYSFTERVIGRESQRDIESERVWEGEREREEEQVKERNRFRESQSRTVRQILLE